MPGIVELTILGLLLLAALVGVIWRVLRLVRQHLSLRERELLLREAELSSRQAPLDERSV